jgi:ankyrin repeat protein
VQVLLNCGAVVDIGIRVLGVTPLHISALYSRSTDTARILLEADADPNARTIAAHTPYELARAVRRRQSTSGVSRTAHDDLVAMLAERTAACKGVG